MNFIPQPVKNFLDSLFNPPLEFLNMIIDYVSNISLIAGRGINLNNYLSFMGYLPQSFQSVLSSLLASVIFIAILRNVKYIMRMYFIVKDAIFRWV